MPDKGVFCYSVHMDVLAFILNLPWTALGLLGALLSVPTSIQLTSKPLAIIFSVRSFWWYTWMPGKGSVRAITNGHVIQLSPAILDKDLEHELIHVEQYERAPLIHPFLYAWQYCRHGYRKNKYEDEAYRRSSSKYIGS